MAFMLNRRIPVAVSTAALIAIAVCGLIITPKAADAQAADPPGKRRPGGFADSGVYVGGTAWGGTLNHMRVPVAADINGRLAEGRNAGCLNVVQLEGDRNWRGDPAQLAAQLTEWLKKTDMSKVDILMLGEEHMYDAGQHLDPLYDLVKIHCDVPVYVWPSAPLGPLGKADGYGYDNYGARYTAFRRKLVEFLSTGKPVVFCIDGSGYSDILSAREQVMVCREFDIPAFYFIADSGSGGMNGWLGGGAVYVPWRNFVFSALEFQRRGAGSSPLSAGDIVWGEPIDLAGDYDGKIAYSWSGIGLATVYGFKRLKIDSAGVRALDQREVSLDYQFWSLLSVENAQLSLSLETSNIKPSKPMKVELSRYGKNDDWRAIVATPDADGKMVCNLGSPGREFRIRITLPDQTAPALKSCDLTGNVAVTDDRATDLGLFVDGWRGGVRYQQNLSAGIWKTMGVVDSPQALEPSGLAMRGVSGGASANVVQKFVSQKPLNNIVIKLTGQCNGRNLGGSFSLGVSLDGKNVIKQGLSGSEPVGSDGTYCGTHIADLSATAEFKGVTAFYVHMGQSNGSGLRTGVSSSLATLEIDAAVGQTP
jgi:hypothetical protein